MSNDKKNRVQVYLKDIHKMIIEKVKEENNWEEIVTDQEVILNILIEYDQLKREKQKLNYIDQNTTMILNLVSSMMTEMNLNQRPLEESVAYFDAKKYVESMLNNPRTIRPNHKIQSQTNRVPSKINDDILIEEEPQPSIFNQTDTSSSLFETDNELEKNAQTIKEMFDTLKE